MRPRGRQSATLPQPPNRARALRLERGLTYLQVAEATGIHYQAVQRFEKTGKGMGLERVCTLAQFYGITVDNLMGLKNDEKILPPLTT